jgi:hypothetical protein
MNNPPRWYYAVGLAPVALPVLGGRCGTVRATLQELARRMGPPHQSAADFADGKVSACWTIATPRGPVHVRDYWWNASEEQSIGAATYRAAMWAARWLRRNGIPAWASAQRLADMPA